MGLWLGLLLGGAVFIILTWALRTPRAAAGERFAHDFAILKAEQAELDAQLASGALSDEEAQPIRNELRRRILTLSRLSEEGRALTDVPVPAAIVAIGVVLAVFAGLYALQMRGEAGSSVSPVIKRAPQRGDLPARADFQALMAEGEARFAAGNPAGAFDAYEAATQLEPGRIEGWLAQGEALVVAERGEISPAAMLAFAQAERVSPGNPVSQYYSGLERLQQGDAKAAQAIWRSLKQRSRPNAPWMGQLERGLVAAAQALGEEPQMQIGQAEIEGMVAGLAARLEDEPNDPQGWIMLTRSYMVLGRAEDAKAALAQLETLSDVPEPLAEQARSLKAQLAQK